LNRHGFTLIEISIVLVIVGLLVGGILVGRDLIKTAEIRATISQIDKLKAATNVFRLKYNALPGDMLPAQAANFGFFELQSGGAQGLGDNNGIIENGAGGASCGVPQPNDNLFAGEIMVFWNHLSAAELIEGHFMDVSDIDVVNCIANNEVDISRVIPAAKIGRTLRITVVSGSGANYFAMLPILGEGEMFAGAYTIGTSGMTPIETESMDRKMDDGRPENGSVIAIGLEAPAAPAAGSPASLIGGATPSSNAVSTNNACVVGTGAAVTDTYNLVSATGANDPSCGLAIRF
jgi:prepilin-type N-terminal cleavage/methylation domain-containing protein